MITVERQGADEFIATLQAIPQRIEQAAKVFVAQATAHAAQRAVPNAPIKTGELRLNIQSEPVHAAPDEVVGAVSAHHSKTGPGGQDVAWLMHELQFPAPAWVYSLGPRTVKQPPTPEGRAGGKYIERVFHYHAAKYAKVLESMVTDVCAGKPLQAMHTDLAADLTGD